jgi:hypothetical protein
MFWVFPIILVLAFQVSSESDESFKRFFSEHNQYDSIPCIDIEETRNQYFQGNINVAYYTWKAFFVKNTYRSSFVSPTCKREGQKMAAPLALLNKDTSNANRIMTWLLIEDVNTELWDLRLPMDLQTYWDSVKLVVGTQLNHEPYSDSNIWANQWLPPLVKSDSNRSEERTRLRFRYHRNRLFYAVATEDQDFEKIYIDIASESDAAFRVLKADLRLRLSYGPKQVRQELIEFPFSSEIIDQGQLFCWRIRTEHQIKNMLGKTASSPTRLTRIDSIIVPKLKIRKKKKR